jgi:hypothetical protein
MKIIAYVGRGCRVGGQDKGKISPEPMLAPVTGVFLIFILLGDNLGGE